MIVSSTSYPTPADASVGGPDKGACFSDTTVLEANLENVGFPLCGAEVDKKLGGAIEPQSSCTDWKSAFGPRGAPFAGVTPDGDSFGVTGVLLSRL